MFLRILAITGIVLLCLVAFIIFIVLLVLFVPVRYKVHADGAGTATEGFARAKWLFGFARAKAELKDSKVVYSVKILFFTVLKGEPGKTGKKEEKKTFEICIGADETDDDGRIGCNDGLSKENIPKKQSAGQNGCEPKKSKKQVPQGPGKAAKASGDLSELLCLIINNILKNAERLKGRILKIHKKLKTIFEKIKKAKYIWDAPVTKRAIKSIKVKFFRLLNHIKPGKIKGELILGLEDPAQTASACAIAGIISGSFGAELIITPDFEEKKFEVKNLHVSGRIFIGYVVILALKLLTDKDVKRVVNYIRRNF